MRNFNNCSSEDILEHIEKLLDAYSLDEILEQMDLSHRELLLNLVEFCDCDLPEIDE